MAQTTTTTRRALCRLPASGGTLLAGMVAFLIAMAPDQVAAASNALGAGKVMPATGTTQTSFTLSVVYISPQGFAANRVVALAANRTVDLTLFSGRADDGVWEATTLLPAGSWQLTFQATAAQGESPTLAGPTIVVSSAPSQTAAPTLAPRPAFQPPPVAPVAPPAAPLVQDPAGSGSGDVAPVPASPVALGAPLGSESEPAGVVLEPSTGTVLQSPANDGFPGGLPWTPMVVAVAGVGAMVGGRRLSAVARRRRRQPAIVPAAPAARPVGATARPPRRLADWELASLDDEPIGTVDYTGLRPLA